MEKGDWYYLHTNGELIHKKYWPGEDDSTFVVRIWELDPTDRSTAWTMLIEALALGASIERAKYLANKWGCNGKDLVEFMTRHRNPSDEQKRGLGIFLSKILGICPDSYWNWLGKTPKGSQPDWAGMPTCPLKEE